MRSACEVAAAQSPLSTPIGFLLDNMELDTTRLTPPRELAREEGQVVQVNSSVSRHCWAASALVGQHCDTQQAIGSVTRSLWYVS